METLTEKDFTKQVLEVAKRFGWMAVHFLPARVGKENRPVTAYLGDGKGFFDIVAVRERVVFAELKIGSNKQTAEQLAWSRQAVVAGTEAYLWRPDDYDDIVKVFAGTRPPRVRVD